MNKINDGAPKVEILLGTSEADARRTLFLHTLAWAGGNKTAAARLLGVSRRSVYIRLSEYVTTGGPCARCESSLDERSPLCSRCTRDIADAAQTPAEKRPRRKLSEAGARAILRRYWAGESLDTLAEEYNVRCGVVRDLLVGRTWRGLDRERVVPAARPGRPPKLPDEQVQEIRRRAREGESQRALALEFRVHERTVSRIKLGKTRVDVAEVPS